MKPLGSKLAIIHKGTRIYDVDLQRYTTMPYTAQVFLLADRNNMWRFVLDDHEYLVHDDNVN